MLIRIRCNRIGNRLKIADENGLVLHESTICGTYQIEIPDQRSLSIRVNPIGENIAMTNFYRSIDTKELTSVFLFPDTSIQTIRLIDKTYSMPIEGRISFSSIIEKNG